MDIERAVDDFVSRGKDLYHQIKSEGGALSSLGLHTLQTQLHILQVEARRIEQNQQNSSRLPSVRSSRRKTSPQTCRHRRVIDDCLDAQGQRTGFVYCLECMAIFKDPAEQRASQA